MSKTKPELFLNRAPFLWVLSLIGCIKGHWKSAPDCCYACLLYLKWEGLYPETTWTPHIQLQQGNCVVLHQNTSFIYSSYIGGCTHSFYTSYGIKQSFTVIYFFHLVHFYHDTCFSSSTLNLCRKYNCVCLFFHVVCTEHTWLLNIKWSHTKLHVVKTIMRSTVFSHSHADSLLKEVKVLKTAI